MGVVLRSDTYVMGLVRMICPEVLRECQVMQRSTSRAANATENPIRSLSCLVSAGESYPTFMGITRRT